MNQLGGGGREWTWPKKLLDVKCMSYSSLRFLCKTFFSRINIWRGTVDVCVQNSNVFMSKSIVRIVLSDCKLYLVPQDFVKLLSVNFFLWKSFPSFSNRLMWIDGRTDNLSISVGSQQVLTLNLLTWKIRWAPNNVSKGQLGFNSAFKGLMRGKKNCAEDFESEWEKDGLMRICEGYWLWSRLFFYACMATGRPCHGMMKELVHRLTSHVQIRSVATCCGLHELVTPLRHDTRRPDIVIVRRVRKIAKSPYCLHRLCVCVCVCVCSFVCVRLSVRMEHLGSHWT
jgi:hypothetical protein